MARLTWSQALIKKQRKTVTGPSSYPTGGFTVTMEELASITDVQVTPSKTQLLEGSDTVYGIRVSHSGNVVTIVVVSASTVGAGPNAWSEIAAGTDLSGINFTVEAWGN